MAKHTATILWERGDAPFIDNRYSRAHHWRFDGGVDVLASSSPHVVRLPFSDPAGIDPEESFIAALSSCHMLSFLYLAAKDRWTVDSYHDDAEGILEKNDQGRMAITRVVLRPRIEFSRSNVPDDATIEALHHAAHDTCYIANSVKTIVTVEAPLTER
jgi:organic hydroperoxide reductase OsmC/OhrA